MSFRKRAEELTEYFDELGEDGRFLFGPAMAMRWGVLEVQTFLASMGGLEAARQEILGDCLEAELAEAADALSLGTEKASAMKYKGAHVTTVRYRLTDADRVYIRNVMMENTYVVFKDAKPSDYNPHPVLRALKDIVDNVLWSCVCKHEVVTEVGPNIISAVMRGPRKGFYHGLVPGLDSLDVERSATARRLAQIKLEQQKNLKLKPNQIAALEDSLLGRRSELFEKVKLQDFNKPTDVIYAVDSVYDIALEDLIYAMHRTGARMFLGSLVNVPTLPDVVSGAVRPEGRVGATEQCWRAYPERDEVVFFFRGASNRAYVHKLSQLVEYYKFASREYEIDGQLYHFRHLTLTNEAILAFDIQRVPNNRPFISEPLPAYRFNGRDQDVVISTSAVNLRYPKGDSRRVTPFDLYVGKDSFSRVLSDRMLRGPGKLEQVINYIRTNRVNIVHNGVRVSCENPVAMDNIGAFATAIDALATQLEYSAQQDLEFVGKTIDTGGWCSPSVTHANDPSMARVLWNKIVSSVAEAAPVSVRDAKEVLVTENKRIVLRGKDESREPTDCDQMKEAVLVLGGARGPINEEEREALECWLAMMKSKGCHCMKCDAEREAAEGSDTSVEQEEWAEEWFDSSESQSSANDAESRAISNSGDATAVEEVGDPVNEKKKNEPAKMRADPLEGTSTVQMDQLIPRVVEVPRVIVAEGKARTTVVEYVEILRRQMEAAESIARRFADRAERNGGFSPQNLAALSNETFKHYAYKTGPMGIIEETLGGAPMPSAVTRLYDPVHRVFRNVQVVKGQPFVSDLSSKTLYSNTDLDVWLNPKTIENLENVLADPTFGGAGNKIRLVNGIWGSGKTFLAKRWFANEWKAGRKTMFLGVSRKPTESVREQLYGENPEGKIWVRTVGSALFHGVTESIDNLIIDEVCMSHAAIVYALRHMLRPKCLWVCGDAMQMPYVPFVAGFYPKHHTFYDNAEMVLLQRGHRCAEDVYAGGLDIYGKDSGIHPCACHERPTVSLKKQIIVSLANVPMEPGVVYLTHGQSVKEKIKDRLRSKGLSVDMVHTMAEYQGDSADKVIVVRDIAAHKKNSIFFDRLRTNVGVSRSTGETIYMTTSREDDYLSQYIRESKSSKNVDIIRENIRQYQDKPGFSVQELSDFVSGKLDKNNPAYLAGERLRKRILGE